MWNMTLAAAFLSLLASLAQADPPAADSPGPTLETHTFAGLLYVKQGRIGTRSEGPDYYLQTERRDYLLLHGERRPWETDETLESLARKMVAIYGTLEEQTLRVERIEAFDVPRLPRVPLQALVEGNGQFAFDFLKQLTSTKPGEEANNQNLAFSPYSISAALGMTFAGARGETATQMARTLGFSEVPAPLLHETFGDLLSILNANPRANDFTIHTANRLWAEVEFIPEVSPTFRKITSHNYNATIESLNLKSDADGSRRTINAWISEQTGQKIPELIPSGGVDKLTRLVLTNAMYFHGYWEFPFSKEATQTASFHVSAKQTVDVPMMQQRASLPYGADDDLQSVALPVKGGMFSLVLVLPREGRVLADIRTRLSGRAFFHLARRMTPQQVELHVPRFGAKSRFELGQTLSAMGMPRAFSVQDADFSGINERKNLYLDKVFHEAMMDVNEAGIEAAAATAVVIRLKSGLPQPTSVVRFDRPFLFALRDNRTGSILFLGQVVNPKL